MKMMTMIIEIDRPAFWEVWASCFPIFGGRMMDRVDEMGIRIKSGGRMVRGGGDDDDDDDE